MFEVFGLREFMLKGLFRIWLIVACPYWAFAGWYAYEAYDQGNWFDQYRFELLDERKELFGEDGNYRTDAASQLKLHILNDEIDGALNSMRYWYDRYEFFRDFILPLPILLAISLAGLPWAVRGFGRKD